MSATHSPKSNGWINREYSPRRQHIDAQRRQVDLDLEQAFKDLRVRDAEVEKLHNLHRRIQNEEAELKESSLAKIHEAALEKAKHDRDVVRQQAEAVLQQHFKEEAEKRRLREEEERQRLQREVEAKAAQERARLEEEKRKKLEQERIRIEAEAKVKAERERQEELKAEAERSAKEKLEKELRKQQQDREQKEREDAARAGAAEEAERKAQAQAQALAQAKAAATTTTTAGRPDDSALREHEEYLALYWKLKEWKNNYWATLRQEAKNPGRKDIKDAVSNARSAINKGVGQLSTGDKETNQKAEGKMIDCLRQLLASPTPYIGQQMPVNFFLPPSLSLNDNDQTVITDQAGFFMCHLVQQVVKLFCSYVSGEPRRAEPIGTMITKIFGNPAIQYARQGTDLPASRKSQSLITIMLAKYHKICPGLFGITAKQNTGSGKIKLGWALVPNENGPKNELISEDSQYDRYAALAIGYSAFALRNASTVKIDNPYPPKYFWKSLAQLINLPPEQVQPIHLCILRNMFGYDGVKRFLLFFGDVGMAALREAFVEFPKRLPDAIKQDAYYKDLVFQAQNHFPQNEQLHLT